MKKISLPLTEESLSSLKANDEVALSGTLIVGRDAASLRLISLINENNKLPISLNYQTIFYLGPSPAPKGRIIGSVGPTTASRMDGLTKPLMEKGLKGMIGKGKRSKEIIQLVKEHKGVYFSAYGGMAAYLSRTILDYKVIAFPELLAEALALITVRDFPAIVAIDPYGNHVF